ncbi:MAG: class I SAM-dependent DNA methyltransferase, partial [Mangrovibacterium sp.]
MNIAQIEQNVSQLVADFNAETFIFDLLHAYGLPKASISRLQNGNLNLAKAKGEISWKKKLRYKEEFQADLHLCISELAASITHDERFVVATNHKTLLAIDTKTQERLDCKLLDLPKYFDFFLPWAGMEKAQLRDENPADVKAAERMGKLFDAIKKDNPDESPEAIHRLNIFLSRLLFCFFAEDTHIFTPNQFTNAIISHTQTDGGDLNIYLDRLFLVLNTPLEWRKDLPEYLNAFPYVNGGLFKEEVLAPKFSASSRAMLIQSGDQDWSAINPDIFGSMFQAVIAEEQRGNLGQHYTSVPNIMKVIEPLFLNELHADLAQAKGDPKKLSRLLFRLNNIRIFDPACGSGNFLLISYKELRRFEMEVMREFNRISSSQMLTYSGIHLSHFYGIEIDDFAGEVAKLALWLAEHQMNVEFFNEFGFTSPTLPLSKAGNIVQGNATRIDWAEVCPMPENGEVFVLGNPPYLGRSMRNQLQMDDMDFALANDFRTYRDLDYIAIWFFKAAQFIREKKAKAAFVSTNSICQGVQVAPLWQPIFKLGVEIAFAHSSFKWTNNAKSNAGVTVAIVGLANTSNAPKFIYTDGIAKEAKQINAYLSDAPLVMVDRSSKPLGEFQEMTLGNMPNDGGNLILSERERKELLEASPEAVKFVRPLMGSQEFIRGEIRYCLWIADEDKEEAERIPF